VDGIAKWIERHAYEHIVHAYIFDGGGAFSVAERDKLKEFVHYLRHGSKRGWERPVEIKWFFRSELKEITPSSPTFSGEGIPFWTTGGRVERGRPRPVCCVDARLARGEHELIDYLSALIQQANFV
jgi:hypothetical protein